MFSISCFEGSTCLANVVIGTVVTFKFVNTCGCVFFVYSVVCGFVCEVPFEGVMVVVMIVVVVVCLCYFCGYVIVWLF